MMDLTVYALNLLLHLKLCSSEPKNKENWCCNNCSMGGHGALVCHLKNPGMYKSVSAMAPICNPSQCPWGHKAFDGYLGSDRTSWAVRILLIAVHHCMTLICHGCNSTVHTHSTVKYSLVQTAHTHVPLWPSRIIFGR